jgi:site-specific DNA-methyltransferase (adenine-specific)
MKPYYESGGITIYHGDCREIIPSLSTCDVVITDPPYGTGWTKAKAGTPVGEFKGKYTREAWDVWDLRWLRQCLALTRRVVVFCPYRKIHELGNEIRDYSLRFWKKTNPRPPLGRIDSPAIDVIFVPSSTTGRGCVNVLEIYNGDTLFHPCQKPIEVMQWLVNSYTKAGDVTLDPFMGSGTTLRAAKDLGRKAIGIEIEEKYCEIAVKRLAQEVLFTSP